MLSVVILAKNEAVHIAACVQSALQVSNDVLVIDSGSTDGTQQIAAKAGANVIEIEWKGFGKTRNEGAIFAKNNWILSLDCDERLSPQAIQSIQKLQLSAQDKVYAFKRLNFLGNTPLHYGEWGRDRVKRLYNRTHTQWTDVAVHETINTHHSTVTLLEGNIVHYTYASASVFQQKLQRYAALYAERHYKPGKKVSLIKRYLSPLFSFIQNYIFRLGFLDGKAGFTVAKLNAYYVWLKYNHLANFVP